jgi:hypothetical protein
VIRQAFPHASAAAAVLFVLLAYALIGSHGTFDFPRVPWDFKSDLPGEGYYGSLAEGFRRGHLSMADEPDARLKAVHDPYTLAVRDRYGAQALWDTSYYHGKYYLYFSPLPVLIFYLPYRWVHNGYPRDGLACAFFCAWAFLAAVATVRRAFANRRLHLPLPLWILLIGLGNIIPWVLANSRVYEVAIAAGMAMSASWAYALVRFQETGRMRDAAWMGVWLGLAIAARTNLAVLLLVMAAVIPLRKWRVWIVFFAPIIAIGFALAAYNYARFHNPLETGITYQITLVPMRDCDRCGLKNIPHAIRVVNNLQHYVWWSPHTYSTFPFVDLQGANLDPIVSFPEIREHMAGIGPIDPLLLLAPIAALLLVPRYRTLDGFTRSGLLLLAGSWLVVLALSTCWYVVARYSMDFMMLMAIATPPVLESTFDALRTAGFRVHALRVAAILLACYSIVLCMLLTFDHPTFRTLNPELFEKLSKKLTPRM